MCPEGALKTKRKQRISTLRAEKLQAMQEEEAALDSVNGRQTGQQASPQCGQIAANQHQNEAIVVQGYIANGKNSAHQPVNGKHGAHQPGPLQLVAPPQDGNSGLVEKTRVDWDNLATRRPPPLPKQHAGLRQQKRPPAIPNDRVSKMSL
jgi:hypothetical protein